MPGVLLFACGLVLGLALRRREGATPPPRPGVHRVAVQRLAPSRN